MGISKTEVNLRRLLAAAPQQQNQEKLVHYVGTLREQLEQLAEERTPEGLPRVSKAMVNDYSEKIESIASKLAAPLITKRDTQVSEEPFAKTTINESRSKTEAENHVLPTPGLRKRFVPASNSQDRIPDSTETASLAPVKLDAEAQAHIEKHRNLQEDLTDDMVGLAQQLKERSLMISQSLQNTEKILDSTEKAVEDSLAGTGRANVRAMKIYSESSRTTCFQWLVIFVMTCIFIMVVLLIRVT
ncbi:uncharacterized protein LOC133875225 isoform X2 [Alnus glutinosa]|uniref:uncharacterized protein LOC133875225 isoform X2 n=1 Tax=Alnus glutinosa TaxID=3517 RepID=UPI002D77CB55|nr:uncharacterized protein LOC133875225 isoform X2 [Alnus glutinosa]